MQCGGSTNKGGSPNGEQALSDEAPASQFERLIMPHLDAAFNLARWLVRRDEDAEDLVQDSCLRAYKALEGFRGGDPRAWLLAIVRNTCYSWLERKNKLTEATTEFDEEVHGHENLPPNAEQDLLARADRERLQDALEAMPPEFREAMVLRELQGLSYKEIAVVTGVPMGTVMSRISRGRRWLRDRLLPPAGKEVGRVL
jgi:RNA polymerase sigma-70 factor, ECF subfamily